jgi:hypothetical protein
MSPNVYQLKMYIYVFLSPSTLSAEHLVVMGESNTLENRIRCIRIQP